MTKKFFGTMRFTAAALMVASSTVSGVSVYAAKLDTAGIRAIVSSDTNYYRSTSKSSTGSFLESNSVEVDRAEVEAGEQSDAKIVVDAPINIVVRVDKQSNDAVATNAETVAEYIAELSAQTGASYICTDRSADEPLTDGMYIELSSKKTESVDIYEEIAYDTQRVETDKLYKGETKVIQKGVKGSKKVTTVNSLEGGTIVSTTTSEEIVAQPVTEIIEVGTKEKVVVVPAAAPSAGSLTTSYKKVLTLDATAYCPCSKCCGSYANGITATGMKAGYGVAAVDPKVIPLGTKLYVEGYGYCVAADTGGAIKSNRIDLCYATHSEALNSGFGHKSVKVYILG